MKKNNYSYPHVRFRFCVGVAATRFSPSAGTPRIWHEIPSKKKAHLAYSELAQIPSKKKRAPGPLRPGSDIKQKKLTVPGSLGPCSVTRKNLAQIPSKKKLKHLAHPDLAQVPSKKD